MFKNYLTIAVRNLLRHIGYSLINIAGLAIGLAGVILIVIFIRHELSYNQGHGRADQPVRKR